MLRSYMIFVSSMDEENQLEMSQVCLMADLMMSDVECLMSDLRMADLSMSDVGCLMSDFEEGLW